MFVITIGITLKERHFRVFHSKMSLLQGDNQSLFRPLQGCITCWISPGISMVNTNSAHVHITWLTTGFRRNNSPLYFLWEQRPNQQKWTIMFYLYTNIWLDRYDVTSTKHDVIQGKDTASKNYCPRTEVTLTLWNKNHCGIISNSYCYKWNTL